MRIYEWWTLWIMTLLYDYDDVLCDCDWGLSNGWGVAFWHTNIDRFPHSSITMVSVGMILHKHEIGSHFLVC